MRVVQNIDPARRAAGFPNAPTPWSTWLALVGFVGLCELVGVAAGAITGQAVHGWYALLARPAGTPPDWVFAPTWTTLYLLIGLAGWLVWRNGGDRRALWLWGWQLIVAAVWTPAFFGLHSPKSGLVVMATMLMLICLTLRAFARICPIAAWLMLPYLLWTCYAAYLNAGFWWLNPA